MLSKYKSDQLDEVIFPSNMGRSLLCSVMMVNEKLLCIATSHLESLNNDKIR
jgi:hypothetical protein